VRGNAEPARRRALRALVALGATGATGAAGIVVPPRAAAQVASPHAIDIPRWFSETFLDFREDVADAARDNKRLVVYFGQDGCPYCKLLMQTTFSETRIVDKARRHFVAVALNLWGDREVTWTDGRRMTEKELARTLGVQFTPTLLFFDEKARVVLRLNGYQPPHRLDATLDWAGGRLESKQRYDDYMQANVKEAASAKLADAPFLLKPPYALRRTGRGKPLLVMFERTHCASCDELHREGFRRREVAALLPRFDVARFEPRDGAPVTTPDGRSLAVAAWARELGIHYAPTLLFFDSAGREVFRVEAYVRPYHLAGALDYVASGAYRSEPNFQRYLQARADAQRHRGEKVDLWK
jgi:thioredoxin-related protein